MHRPYIQLKVVGVRVALRQNSRWDASVGGAVRQTPTTILSPTFRVNMILSLPAIQSAPTLLRSE